MRTCQSIFKTICYSFSHFCRKGRGRGRGERERERGREGERGQRGAERGREGEGEKLGGIVRGVENQREIKIGSVY